MLLKVLPPFSELKLVWASRTRQNPAAGGREADLKFTSAAEIPTYPEAARTEGQVVAGSQSQKDVKGQEGHLP